MPQLVHREQISYPRFWYVRLLVYEYPRWRTLLQRIELNHNNRKKTRENTQHANTVARLQNSLLNLKIGNCFERKKKIQIRHIWVVHHSACGYTGCGMLATLQTQHAHGTYICATNNLATVNLFIRLHFGLAISHTNHVGLRYLHIFGALCY